jgi:HEPN domain-containing protein
MPHDPERIAEVSAWLSKAASDLRIARLGNSAKPPLNDQAVYHAHQAAEKAMKGFLAWNDKPFRKTHNLVEIGEACVAVDPSLEDLFRRAATLTEYGWKFRYPGELCDPPAEEAAAAIALSEDVVRAVLDRLPNAVNSQIANDD